MRHPHLDGGQSPVQNDKAACFSALVRCSVEEAEQWLSRSCGSMEAALDEYLTRQRSLKRQKASSDSPRPEGLPEFASRRDEHITQNQLKAGTPKAEAFSKRNMNSALRNGAASSPEAATRSQVVVIDLANETEDEDATAADEPLRCSPSASPGKSERKNYIANLAPSVSFNEHLAPDVNSLPSDFSFFLGECVASGTVTSGTISKLSLTDPLSLMVEMRLPHTQKVGAQQAFRKVKASNRGYRIVYIHLDDPVLLEHQKHLVQPELRARDPRVYPHTGALPSDALQGLTGGSGSRTTFLRLLIDGREAARFDREVASSLAALLLVGAVKANVCWLPDRLPPRRLAVNSSIAVRMTVQMTVQALRLSALMQRGDSCLNQVLFPALMGQALSALIRLVDLQPVGASPTPRENETKATVGPTEDMKLSAILGDIRARRRTRESCHGESDTEEATESCMENTSYAAAQAEEGCEQSHQGIMLDSDDDEAAEKSGVLCQLVLGEGAVEDHKHRERKRIPCLGALYPPASVFVSRLRPYQAQGLWWMLRCESEQSIDLEDSQEELDPLWRKYILPSRTAHQLADDSVQCDHPLPMVTTRLSKTAAVFVPRYLYVNTSSGLVSIEKPNTTGRVKGGILADCMGLGKTVQVLALIAVSLFQERDPRGAAAWLATSTCNAREEERPSSKSGHANPVRSPIEPSEIQTAGSDTSPASPPLVCNDSLVTPSPVSVSSDGDIGGNSTDEPATKLKRNSLLAPNPLVLQRTLRRDKEKLLQGGTLIVVPLSLIGQWHSEVERHLARGVATVLQYYGPARPRDPKVLAAHTIVLTSYQTLASDFRHLAKRAFVEMADRDGGPQAALKSDSGCVAASPIASIRFRRVILDEGHAIKNTASLVNRACNAVKADSRWILTGTPLQNDLWDAFALVQFLRVSPMGDRRWWEAKVTQPMEKGMVRAAIDTVRSTLVPLMLRRQGDQAGEDGKPLLPLPPLTVHTFKLQLTYEERLFYQTVFEDTKAKFDQLVQSGQVLQHYTHVLQFLLRLRQACNHPLLPSYREEQRRQQFIDTVLPVQGTSAYRSKETLTGQPHIPSSSYSCSDPVLRKYIQDALDGKLENCPVCHEPPRDAVVLTTCWHLLCVSCLSLLEKSSDGTPAACPTCNKKFLNQNIRLLPAGSNATVQRWKQVVLRKHRELIAAAEAKKVPKNDRKEVQSSDGSHLKRGMCLARTASGAFPVESLDTASKALRGKPEELFQDVPDDAFFFSTKIRLLLALLEADVAAGRSCVIFSQWTSMLDLLEMAFARAEAVRAISQTHLSNTTTEVDADDDVIEMGVTFTRTGPAKAEIGGLHTKKEGARLGCKPEARRNVSANRLYNYRRIDGTLGLEARQRAVKWFLGGESPLGTTEDTSTADLTETEEGPFMGQCSLKPFNCMNGSAEASLRVATPASSRRGTERALGAQTDSSSPPGHGKILLLSLKTGNVGLNLVKATRCYIVDGWWNPQVEKQAMRRLWRYGQDQPVSVFRFVCARTVEERMEELIEWKGRLSRSTLRSGDVECSADIESGDEDSRRRGRLSLQDLKKLFEGWDADLAIPEAPCY